MYSIFKSENGNSVNYVNNYFIYSSDNNIMSAGKIINAKSKIEENNKQNILVMDIEDKNIFLNISFHYSINLLPFLIENYKNLNLIDFIKYNSIIYTNNNSGKTKIYTDNLNKEFFKEYKRHKQANALDIFGDKYSNKILFNNNLFLDANILFLSNNISKLKKPKEKHGSYNNIYYTSFNEDCYLFLYKINKLSDKLQKYQFYNNNITYGNNSYLLKNLLKLKPKETYSITSNNFSIQSEVLYSENVFIRLSDFNIDIKDYKNIFDIGIKNKKVLYPVLSDIQNISLNNFKKVCINKCNELIDTLHSKINFINNIDLNKMYIN